MWEEVIEWPRQQALAARLQRREQADGSLKKIGVYKADKNLRRYGATIERVLGSWEISPQEWADYIAFLGRLLKAIQSHPRDAPLLPHSDAIASKLAQCLNPALPSGVHQKALEVYEYIFSTLGGEYVSAHLHEFLPGLSSVLSFASLSVKPGLYSLFEDHVVKLPAEDLRPMLKSLILSLLPALEEETSEDFGRAFQILETLERSFSSYDGNEANRPDKGGYFWQCLFLAVITSPSRRQGSLNYLSHRLPKISHNSTEGNSQSSNASVVRLSSEAEAVVSPEPGLLIRCFSCGLSDTQVLVQRGFLDLLVTKLPLNSPLLQHRVSGEDLDRLVAAASHVLLRREMSLNRRLWSWFLGPDPKDNISNSQPPSPIEERKKLGEKKESLQFQYFSAYGKASLERCMLAMFKRSTMNSTERARPFRICLSLMDRWEIGGTIVPNIFLQAIESTYRYSLIAPSDGIAEVMRSASLFFDGVEAKLIWINLIKLLQTAFAAESPRDNLALFAWILQRFNMKDEEMLTVHVPYAALYLLLLLQENDQAQSVLLKRTNAALEIVSNLLELIPERAFSFSDRKSLTNGAVDSVSPGVNDARTSVEHFYQGPTPLVGHGHPIGGPAVAELLPQLVANLMIQNLDQESNGVFSRAVSILLILHSKIPTSGHVTHACRLDSISRTVILATERGGVLMFQTINAIVSLVTNLSASQQELQMLTKSDPGAMEAMLMQQLWFYLSPANPKYHLEAVKLIWQLQDSRASDSFVEASVTSLLRQPPDLGSKLSKYCAESMRRFTVLWGHTVPAPPSAMKSGQFGLARRGSAMPSISDSKQALRRLASLTEPLMLTLDLLDGPDEQVADVVRSWLQTLPTLEQVLTIHFDALKRLMDVAKSQHGSNVKAVERRHRDNIRDIDYIIRHLLYIVLHGNAWTSQCLTELVVPSMRDGEPMTGTVFLADCCCRFICTDDYASHGVDQKAIDLLSALLSGPSAPSLKFLNLDERLIARLMDLLSKDRYDLQGPLLKLVTQSLKVRLMNEGSEAVADSRPGSSIGGKRSSLTGLRLGSNALNQTSAKPPPPQLAPCLQMAFASISARPHLDQWIEFLSSVLPVFADAIFTNLIQLVESLCNELRKLHSELQSLSEQTSKKTYVAPEITTMAILEALEMILSRAHECLDVETVPEPQLKAPSQSRSILGNVTSGVFRAEGPPSRTTQANSRLTVVLSLQDAVRVSLQLWIWATHYSNIPDFDKTSAATSSYNALRVRNRTRHLLEQMFNAQPLESLEVIISHWHRSPDRSQSSAALNLLHVMRGSRPKNMVPAILDALCSRTNPAALPLGRQSNQTVELSATEISLFFSAYLQSTEDDAMDELWSDCMAFMKDVLSNPLPHRLVLPSLLSVTLLLAQKADNTNFGEQRKMRRELGDMFLRLMAAAFTTMPSGYVVDPAASETQLTRVDNSDTKTDRKSTSLISVLKSVTENIEVILETPDRISSAVNSISTSLLAPLFHAKSFPSNITSDSLGLLLQMTKKAPSAKSWRKEIMEAFNDPKLLTVSAAQMERDWFPVLRQWCLYDKERMPELLSRLTAPSSAGIMFGVGASAARLEADRKTQLNLRRIIILLLASPEDTFIAQSRVIEEKMIELFDASVSSSPSAMIKTELFMLCRSLVLSTSSTHLAPMWPIMNDNLRSALASLLPNVPSNDTFGNLSLVQACKLLDLLVTISPDEFQLHEWLYISDTIDAVYQPSEWAPSALSDQIAESLALDGVDENDNNVAQISASGGPTGQRRLLLNADLVSDVDDIKAMTREDFARAVLRPFLSQLSIHAYEGVYSMDTPDLEDCRRNLLEDVLDLSTIVE